MAKLQRRSADLQPGARLAAQGAGAAAACSSCHGVQGEGQAAARFPRLAGLSATCLQHPLEAYADGRRNTAPSGQMPRIAKALGERDARSLAAWYAALPMPPAAERPPEAISSSQPALTSGPTAATTPTSGTGAEQGAPLTGGDIGPGGAGATQQPGPAASSIPHQASTP